MKLLQLDYPIYGTYEQHQRAQQKDRIKNFPNGQVRRLFTDTTTWKTHARVTPSKMYVTPNCTTADYVEAFCAANQLIQSENAAVQEFLGTVQKHCEGIDELNRMTRKTKRTVLQSNA
jgi:hypothetical protein